LIFFGFNSSLQCPVHSHINRNQETCQISNRDILQLKAMMPCGRLMEPQWTRFCFAGQDDVL